MSTIQVTCALIEEGGALLVAQRPSGKPLEGKWEFPGGKIDPGETPEDCLRREIEEELGCLVGIGAPLAPVIHTYPNRRIELFPFRCSIITGTPQALEHKAIGWCEPEKIYQLDLADADVPVLDEYLKLRKEEDGSA